MRSPGSIEVIEGDITRIEADAIVNAANEALMAGGGVCGAIFRAAGRDKLGAACAAIGGCATGRAVLTPAFGISSAQFIIHAVGPVYGAHDPATARELLRSAYVSAIALALEHGCESIAIPAISTGIYGYPLQEACAVAAAVCAEESARSALRIKLVAFDRVTADSLRRHVAQATESLQP